MSALYKRDAYLETEGGRGIHEVIMEQSTIQDNKPIHIGVAILQHSKLMLLNFVDFLRDFLIPDSFVFVYGDTDSITLGTTLTGSNIGTTRKSQMEQIFLPLVQPNKMEEFKQKWGRWLVLSNEVEDEKCPGRLKVEFMTQNGQMVSLAPKSYFAHCRDSDVIKDGRKGIPKWFDLQLNDFLDVLYNDGAEKNVTEVRSLRLNKDKQMARTTTRKAGLTGIHVKLCVQSDRITCSPLQRDNQFM